jgi:hypothetical protein
MSWNEHICKTEILDMLALLQHGAREGNGEVGLDVEDGILDDGFFGE